jgi:hypothetical protein
MINILTRSANLLVLYLPFYWIFLKSYFVSLLRKDSKISELSIVNYHPLYLAKCLILLKHSYVNTFSSPSQNTQMKWGKRGLFAGYWEQDPNSRVQKTNAKANAPSVAFTFIIIYFNIQWEQFPRPKLFCFAPSSFSSVKEVILSRSQSR